MAVLGLEGLSELTALVMLEMTNTASRRSLNSQQGLLHRGLSTKPLRPSGFYPLLPGWWVHRLLGRYGYTTRRV